MHGEIFEIVWILDALIVSGAMFSFVYTTRYAMFTSFAHRYQAEKSYGSLKTIFDNLPDAVILLEESEKKP